MILLKEGTYYEEKISISIGLTLALLLSMMSVVSYVPVRAISEALNKDVRWDSTTNSVIINDYMPSVSSDPELPQIKKQGRIRSDLVCWLLP